MKTCTIYGHLASDSTAENYPIVQVCDQCYAADQKSEDDCRVVSAQQFDAGFGDTCEFCGKTIKEEKSGI